MSERGVVGGRAGERASDKGAPRRGTRSTKRAKDEFDCFSAARVDLCCAMK